MEGIKKQRRKIGITRKQTSKYGNAGKITKESKKYVTENK